MVTVEGSLRTLIQHPRRGLFVIIVTCVIGLVAVWPVVDEYFVLMEDCARLELSIVEAQQEIASIAELRQLASAQAQQAAKLRKKMLVVEDVHKFSSQLVELTRGSGCQLRRVDLGECQKRKWSEGDHPLKPQPQQVGAKESPYELRTQRVALSITGPMDRVQSLLGEMRAIDKIAHTQSIQIKPSEDRSEVHLDVELLFFDLAKVKKSGES